MAIPLRPGIELSGWVFLSFARWIAMIYIVVMPTSCMLLLRTHYFELPNDEVLPNTKKEVRECFYTISSLS